MAREGSLQSGFLDTKYLIENRVIFLCSETYLTSARVSINTQVSHLRKKNNC